MLVKFAQQKKRAVFFVLLALVAVFSAVVLSPKKSSQAQTTVDLYGIYTNSFTDSGSYTNPFTEASATITFTAPDASTATIPLFWDGGDTWRVRFSPDQTGSWSYTTTSGDSGLNNQSGSFSVVASANKGGIVANPSYPYHFQYQDGTDFWWMGDTDWALFSESGTATTGEKHVQSTVNAYIAERAGQGINVITGSLINPKGWTNSGGSPYTTLSTEAINPAYWQYVDQIVQELNDNGIVGGIMLAWAQDQTDLGDFPDDASRVRYAEYITSRYSAYNVYFIVAGEYNEDPSLNYTEMANEIVASDPHDRLLTMHSTGSVEVFATESFMSFGDYQQVYSGLHTQIAQARDHNKPVVNAEYAYYLRDSDGDGVVDKDNSATLEAIRNASYDIVMAGGYLITGFGSTYFGGYRHPVGFNEPNTLITGKDEADWESDMQHMKTVFALTDWWNLQPNDSLVTSSGTAYALSRKGEEYLVYSRDTTSDITLSLQDAASASYNITRFDPRTGQSTVLDTYTGTGSITLDVPSSAVTELGETTDDWLFLVQNQTISNAAPTVSISAGSTQVYPDQNVSFSVTASDPDGSIASYEWNWGNATEPGTGSPTSPKTHSWSSTGDYNVTLTVTDDGSPASQTTSNTIQISVTNNLAPTITSAQATPNTGYAPLEVTLTAAATDPEDDVVTFSWDYNNDGTYDETGASVTHTFATPANYSVGLKASDGVNDTVTALTVDVDDPDFSWTQTDWSGGAGQTSWVDSTMYSSGSQIDASTSGQVSLGQASSGGGGGGNWYNENWLARKSITIDADQVAGSANFTDFPVLISITDAQLIGDTQTNGEDIVFTSSDGLTKLNHEIESYDAGSGSLVAWVKVPSLSYNVDTTLYMYYDNSGAAAQETVTSTWKSSFKMVQHLHESPANAVADGHQDSSSNDVDGTAQGFNGTATSTTNTAGKLDGANFFDGLNDYVELGNGDLGATSSFTISAWIYPTAFPVSELPIINNTAGPGYRGWALMALSTGKLEVRLSNDCSTTITRESAGTFSTNAWAHVVGVYDASTQSLSTYINGTLTNGTLSGTVPASICANGVKPTIGTRQSNNRFFTGKIDEVRFLYEALSADWIATEYANQNTPASFYTVSNEEAYAPSEYYTSGTFTSSIFDTQYLSNWNELAYTLTTTANATASVKVRTGLTSNLSGVADFSTCDTIGNGVDMSNNNCVTDGDRFVQYQVNFTTNNIAETAVLRDITLNYSVTNDTPPPDVSISINENTLDFGLLDTNQTIDTTAAGLNDPKTVTVHTGPADLDIRSAAFADGSSNSWSLGAAAGVDTVKWEFSPDQTNWTTFSVADALYTLANAVSEGNTQNVYFKLTTPSTTTSHDQYSTTLTVVASEP